MDLIDALFGRYGKDLSDADHLATPESPAIMASAKAAFNEMKHNDLRYMPPAQKGELYNKYRIDE
jgi:hypothetical protein